MNIFTTTRNKKLILFPQFSPFNPSFFAQFFRRMLQKRRYISTTLKELPQRRCDTEKPKLRTSRAKA